MGLLKKLERSVRHGVKGLERDVRHGVKGLIGGPDAPAAPVTPEMEKQQSKIAYQKYLDWRDGGGRQAENAAIERMTGMRIDPNTGAISVAEGGRLNPDGSVYLDTGAAAAANEAAETDGMLRNYDPRRVYGGDTESRAGEIEGALQATGLAGAQQTSVLQGFNNVARMGQGQETATIQGQMDMAGQAAQNSMADAESRYNKNARRQQGINTVLGAGTRYGLGFLGGGAGAAGGAG